MSTRLQKIGELIKYRRSKSEATLQMILISSTDIVKAKASDIVIKICVNHVKKARNNPIYIYCIGISGKKISI